MTGVILSDKEVNNILNEQDKEIKSLKEENEQLKNRLKQAIHEINDYTCSIKQLQDKIDVKEAFIKQSNMEHKGYRLKLTEILRKHHNYAYEQCQKNLDNPVVHRAYDIIRYDVRQIAKEMGIDLND